MRVGIIGLAHESNTFIERRTTLEHFEQDALLAGEAVREEYLAAHHEIGGFLEGLERERFEAVPLFSARAMPFGPIEADTFETLLAMLWRELDKAGPLDGLLVAPHGAAVSEHERDADGCWLSRLRERVGPRLPIVGTLDPHGNLSPKMVGAVNALVAYRTNPHLDQRQRGLEAASLLARDLRGEIRLCQAAAFPPVAINIERQHTTEPHCRRLYQRADELLQQPGALSNSIMLGFPYADVEEMGSAFVAVADNDPALAQRQADALAAELWEHRRDFAGNLISIEAALDQAAPLEGPVCLLDMGDNVGGGSPGDSTFLIRAVHERRLGPACACLWDPESVAAAAAAGVGRRTQLRVGGKTDQRHGAPLEAEFTVQNVCAGKFRETRPRHGGHTEMDQGACAVVSAASGLTLLLTSRRMPPFSLVQLTSAGIEPRQFKILVAKGVHAPVAAYQEVCQTLIRVNTPGVTTADMNRLDYRHRRRPLYPLESAE